MVFGKGNVNGLCNVHNDQELGSGTFILLAALFFFRALQACSYVLHICHILFCVLLTWQANAVMGQITQSLFCFRVKVWPACNPCIFSCLLPSQQFYAFVVVLSNAFALVVNLGNFDLPYLYHWLIPIYIILAHRSWTQPDFFCFKNFSPTLRLVSLWNISLFRRIERFDIMI